MTRAKKVPLPSISTVTEIYDWIDGDTYHGRVYAGDNTWRGSHLRPERIRIAIIQAPEINTVAGTASKLTAETLFPSGGGLYRCWEYGREPSFGRILVDLVHLNGKLMSEIMLLSNQAVPYK